MPPTATTTPEPAITIRLESVDVRFGTALALRDVSLDVAAGSFVAVVGPSGCGKSTLLRLAAELIQPTSGSIDFGNQRSPKRGFVFQQPTLLPWRRVPDNIALPLELMRKPKIVRYAAADAARKLVGLADEDMAKLPRMLSGGMQMRVSIARALVTQPDIMLFDEPFGALDDIMRGQLNEELSALWKKHRWTTVFVTHNVAEAVLMSERVVVLTPSPGTVAAEIPVNLPHPRRLELRGSPEFASIVGQVGSALREAAA
jgi:NitT/TauT family transport system ATP-binding protein